ncbi:SH3 domain-containing protein [Streptomyces sp. NPDC091272]|uniref:SH3 domain-containing protein n=1 Tax=Streptomyces sp. NPDC091272 TaxID=3365981 RepID=UPI0038038160
MPSPKKFVLYVAAGALTATLAAPPALAATQTGAPQTGARQSVGLHPDAPRTGDSDDQSEDQRARERWVRDQWDWAEEHRDRQHQDDRQRHTEGRVTARGGLELRDKPTSTSDVIRTEPYGATVHIFCQTVGDHVGGNDRWYQLTDGVWAWGSAQHITPKSGHTPRWC